MKSDTAPHAADPSFACTLPWRGRRGLALLVAVVSVGLLAAGCAKAQAEAMSAGPPLEMPPPPPRVLAPVSAPLASSPAAASVPVAGAPVTPAGVPPPRASTGNSGATRQEAAPEPATRDEPPAAAAEPPRALSTAPSAETAALRRKVRDLLDQSAKDLSRVNYQGLSSSGKTQYDAARRLRERADAALKGQDFVFALELADNAAKMAAQLSGVR